MHGAPRAAQLSSAQPHFNSTPLSSAELNSTQLNSAQLNSTQLSSTQLNLTSPQLNSAQLNSAQLKSTQLRSTQLTAELNSTQLSSTHRPSAPRVACLRLGLRRGRLVLLLCGARLHDLWIHTRTTVSILLLLSGHSRWPSTQGGRVYACVSTWVALPRRRTVHAALSAASLSNVTFNPLFLCIV